MSEIYHKILIKEFKIKASILQKTSNSPIKRKQALTNIAATYGFKSWKELKDYCQNPIEKRLVGGFLNHWFVDYLDAKEYLMKKGGYLLPFRNQYFISDSSFIQAIGLKPNSPYWTEIGYDFVYPKNQKALILFFLENLV